jgi:hypothetical protein
VHKECLPRKGWEVFDKLGGLFAQYNAILAGGTALALHLGHRVSRDLDFFTERTFQVESVIAGIRNRSRQFQIMSEGETYLVADVENIKVSLFGYPYPFLDKAIIYKGTRIAGILDIAAMKVIAIGQRGTKRDFVDLYYVLQEIPFHKIAGHMILRFGKARINPVHTGKSLVYFPDAESNPDPEYRKGKETDWERIKQFFKLHVKQFVLDIGSAMSQNQ